jgi:hypothetical protein
MQNLYSVKYTTYIPLNYHHSSSHNDRARLCIYPILARIKNPLALHSHFFTDSSLLWNRRTPKCYYSEYILNRVWSVFPKSVPLLKLLSLPSITYQAERAIIVTDVSSKVLKLCTIIFWHPARSLRHHHTRLPNGCKFRMRRYISPI